MTRCGSSSVLLCDCCGNCRRRCFCGSYWGSCRISMMSEFGALEEAGVATVVEVGVATVVAAIAI